LERFENENMTPCPIHLGLIVGLSFISALIKAEAASRMRTPLAELAVMAIMLLILALFWTAEKSVGCYLKTHSIFIDKLFISISHSLLPPSGSQGMISLIIGYHSYNYPIMF